VNTRQDLQQENKLWTTYLVESCGKMPGNARYKYIRSSLTFRVPVTEYEETNYMKK
jgi:hypothetical protein